jgi:hypothetical protein
MRKGIALVAVLALFAGSVSADTLWDNGIVPNGVNGRAISPPAFPNIRVVDDATFSGGVNIQDFHANVIQDGGWTHDGNITLEVYADTGNGPGAVVATHSGEFTSMDTGDDYFGRSDFDYWIEGIDINLGAGTYWFGFRNQGGGGAGTNYWMTSDGGPDGAGTSNGYFSLDGGNTWSEELPEWQHAFVVTGTPEPSTCLLLGLGGLALLRRRR